LHDRQSDFYYTVANDSRRGEKKLVRGEPSVHQILGLRPWFNEKKGVWDITDSTFFKKNWRAPSLTHLFANLEEYLAKVKPEERFNLFYTVAICAEGKRQFREQANLVFDIDGIDSAKEGYFEVVASVINVPTEKLALVRSGNGVHIIAELAEPIIDPLFFENNRRHYAAICDKINAALVARGLPGKTDPSVFDPRRIMRLPGTVNRKEGKAEKKCELIKPTMTAVSIDLAALSGLPSVEASDHINAQNFKKYPKSDTESVLTGCEFLKECKSNPNGVSEEQWYASLSILGRLDNGKELAHEYSRGHRSYSMGETDAKLEQALQASGPRTCSNINKVWGKCSTCPYFEKVTSPIVIRGSGFLKTKDTGFHNIIFGENGPKIGQPNYEDLRAYFEHEQPYVVLAGTVLVWTGTHYEELPPENVKAFAQKHFDPPAKENMRCEFLSRVLVSNLKTAEWFEETTARKMAFKNGVLDFDTKEFMPHDPQRGFRHVLPYDYDPTAQAPIFRQFMKNVTADRQELEKILLEFAGYSFSNDSCWAGKCLIMTGEGRNGKSTWMKVLEALAGGKDKVASLNLADVKSEVMRSQLDGRLFNLAEETPVYAAIENSAFKNLVTGGTTIVKQLYKQPYNIKNRCKFMFACNELPKSRDATNAYLRRLLIVPFEVKFEGKSDDKQLDKKLLGELPGIFNLVLEGYHRLKAQQEFTASSVAHKQLEEYRLEIDTVASWADAALESRPAPWNDHVPVTKLYASYVACVEQEGAQPVPMIAFARALSKVVPDYEKRKKRVIIDGIKRHVIQGVAYAEASNF
jgi:P4 family phage/plasmid primase-like protien